MKGNKKKFDTLTCKNGELTFFISKDYEYVYIDVRSKTSEVAANAYFKIKDGVCFLGRIEVLQKYSHQGVGTKILNIIEQIAISNYCRAIDGKFFPFGNLGIYAKSFYEKNGYEIYKEDYETYIYKRLLKTNQLEKSL